VGNHILHKEIKEFNEVFYKHGLNIDKCIFAMNTADAYKFTNDIFKLKIDKSADDISVTFNITEEFRSNDTHVRFATEFSSVITASGTYSRSLSSLHPQYLHLLRTGVGRGVIPSHLLSQDEKMYSQWLFRNIYSFKLHITPVIEYVIPKEVVESIYSGLYPVDIDLSLDSWILNGVSVQKVPLSDDIVTGFISISKNLIIKEFAKSLCPVSLYIYKLADNPGVYIFRFQGICDGMASATDGHIVAITK
jgi:hypothetical protein